MVGDGFAFAIRVSRQEKYGHALGRFAQLVENFDFARNDLVVGFEFFIWVDTQLTLGQVFNVPYAGFYDVFASQIFLDGLCLGRRFDNDQRLLHYSHSSTVMRQACALQEFETFKFFDTKSSHDFTHEE